jgi:hypothetical protein
MYTHPFPALCYPVPTYALRRAEHQTRNFTKHLKEISFEPEQDSVKATELLRGAENTRILGLFRAVFLNYKKIQNSLKKIERGRNILFI